MIYVRPQYARDMFCVYVLALVYLSVSVQEFANDYRQESDFKQVVIFVISDMVKRVQAGMQLPTWDELMDGAQECDATLARKDDRSLCK